eukprot:CAMPEP_0181141272 /NCGR_PEP_ID=MMETSP1071-20121207/35737_1 /TAXON_ID=35127 /ORGANISM="Thalassiosira sp., Strain NH16" /LENGTH=422 /DNA_ID=CAMNT_0023228255 /DNA_START=1 /DNA_END=1269 /DNA_ORIENTATION=+
MAMDPASSSSSCPSSDDDSSTSSGSSSGEGGGEKDQTETLRERDVLEPVDSDDVSTSSDEDEDEDEQYGARQDVSNFDDLPTDDSEDESDTDNSDSDSAIAQTRGVSSSYGEGSSDGDDEEDINQEDLPLSERVASRASAGRRYYAGEDDYDGGKKRRAERKSRAIELATERLRDARKENGAFKSKAKRGNFEGSDDGSVEEYPSLNESKDEQSKRKKKSKHAPTEMSSRRRDYFARGRPDLNSSGIGVSIGANKYKARDPRMVSLSGHLDADTFDKRYGFLDEVQEKEIEHLKRRVGAWQKSGKKGQRERNKLGMTAGGGSLDEDKEELTRLLQERAERKRADVVRAAKRSVKQKIKTDVAEGKRGVYYPKRSELKKMEAEAKYEEIRKRGGNEAVDKAIAKRRKKNLAKEAKSMPSHMVS